MPKKMFIGVAWPYVNGDIHVGHLAGYLLPADIFARFHRFLGNDVLMVSGSDCFGTPITLEADQRKLSPQQIVDEYHKRDVKLFQDLGISYDLYTKTDTENHKKIVQDFFLKLLKKKLIFKNKTEQYYSKEENKFLPDRYVTGECPHCNYKDARSDQCDKCGAVLAEGELIEPKSKLNKKPVELKETEHYFLDWPKLESFLKSFVNEKSSNWRKWVKNETEGWLKTGLKPRAITRDLDWGIPIPKEKIPENLQIDNIEHKRFYVWFEAVIGYLSASIEWSQKRSASDPRQLPQDPRNSASWKNWWYNKDAEHSYFMGKDNLVFHTLFWPGQLHAYDENLHLPDLPAINQFLHLEGEQFSKSRGVILKPHDIIEKYGNDPLRFYLTSIMPEKTDASFSWPDFLETNNSILIGNLGNFINRTLTLAKNEKLTNPNRNVSRHTQKLMSAAKKAMENAEFKQYLNIILDLSDFGNKYLSKKAPWIEKNHGSTKFHKTISSGTYIILGLLALIKPLLPDTYKKLSQTLNTDFKNWPRDKEIKDALEKIHLTEVKPLFTKH